MMRQQGFFGAAMLPVSQLECTGIIEIFSVPGSRFRNRSDSGGSSGCMTLRGRSRHAKNAMWLIARLCRCVSRSRKSPM